MLLYAGHQLVDLFVVVNIDKELSEGAVLPLRSVNKHETQTASADERSDMGDVGLSQDVPLNIAGESLRFPNIEGTGQKGVYHELRPRRWREKALIDLPEADQRRQEERNRNNHDEPSRVQRHGQQLTIG